MHNVPLTSMLGPLLALASCHPTMWRTWLCPLTGHIAGLLQEIPSPQGCEWVQKGHQVGEGSLWLSEVKERACSSSPVDVSTSQTHPFAGWETIDCGFARISRARTSKGRPTQLGASGLWLGEQEVLSV